MKLETYDNRNTDKTKERGLRAGLHWWKPRPSGRTQSRSLSLKIGVLDFWFVGDGEYVTGVAPVFPAIRGEYQYRRASLVFDALFHSVSILGVSFSLLCSFSFRSLYLCKTVRFLYCFFFSRLISLFSK